MGFSRNKNNVVDVIHEAQPKKIVIIAGPTFGTVVGFLVLGAAIGATGVLYLKGKCASSGAELGEASATGDGYDSSAFTARANGILQRIKTVTARARDTIHVASEAIAPAVQEAIKEAKSTASQTQHDLEEELEKAKEG